MGVPERMTNWTAWAYGHPRKGIVQQLASKVSGARPARKVAVATGVRTFEKMLIRKAIFATGWDGSIVLEADTSGGWKLLSDLPHAPLVATPRNPVARTTGPGKVNLNTASADQLDTLPMIGLKRAKQIVAFREARGPFVAIDDLLNVPGMGNGTLKAVRHLIDVK